MTSKNKYIIKCVSSFFVGQEGHISDLRCTQAGAVGWRRQHLPSRQRLSPESPLRRERYPVVPAKDSSSKKKLLVQRTTSAGKWTDAMQLGFTLHPRPSRRGEKLAYERLSSGGLLAEVFEIDCARAGHECALEEVSRGAAY